LPGTLAVSQLSGFEFGDGHLMAAETDLRWRPPVRPPSGGGPPAFYRDEDHLALSRRLLVDALAYHSTIVRIGERFRVGCARGTTGRAEPGPYVVRRCDGARHAR
jgi:hypothetical protein